MVMFLVVLSGLCKVHFQRVWVWHQVLARPMFAVSPVQLVKQQISVFVPFELSKSRIVNPT